MADLTESPSWTPGIYQIEMSDPVLGGPGGIANRQAEQLAARTLWLKDEIEQAGTDLAEHVAAEDPHPQYATELWVAAQIASLINSAPGALDTLNELAAALGNDPNFASTLTNSLSGKVAISSKATLAQAQAGTDDTTWMTPLKTAQAIAALATIVAATEVIAGKVELATNAETIAGTDTSRATHPAGVKAAIQSAISALVNSSPAALDTLNELATALGNDPNFATTMTNALAGKAPLSSPAFTGTPTAPTPAAGTNTTQLATTAFVATAVAGAGGTTLGNTAGAALAASGSAGAATTAARSDHVHPYPTPAQIGAAPLASPAFTGTPTAPTAAAGTNTTQLATTAFVATALSALVNSSPAALDTLKELATALGNDANFATTMTNALAGKVQLGGDLGTPSSGNVGNCTVDGTNKIGYRNIPQTSPGAAYTCVLSDAGKHVYQTTGGTVTIPANASVAFAIGDAITIVSGASQISIAITTDTMRLAGAGTTGTRTLAAYGMATAIKVAATEWRISGTGLS